MGNKLHPFSAYSSVMTIGPTGTLVITYPSTPVIPTDMELDLQGMVADPVNPTLGIFTRRILLDFNH